MKNVIKSYANLTIKGIKSQPAWIGKVCKNVVQSTSVKDFVARHKKLTIETIDLMAPEQLAFYKAIKDKFGVEMHGEEIIAQSKEYLR